MIRPALWLLLVAGTAGTAAQATDFGIRTVGRSAGGQPPSAPASMPPPSKHPFQLTAASNVGARWGRVTSTYRTAERNRRVGGVRNSWHLSGRAVDIARRPGVSHAQIAAAFRAAGYRLIESLDEGDHSHFAFATDAGALRARRPIGSTELTQWGIVLAPRTYQR